MEGASINRGTERGDILQRLLLPLRTYLDDPQVTEICINRQNEVYTLSDKWRRYDAELPYPFLDSLVTAAAVYVRGDINDQFPILSGILPDRERIQAVISPAVDPGIIAITIRKPSGKTISFDEYSMQGFFDTSCQNAAEPALQSRRKRLNELYHKDDKREFIITALTAGLTFVVAGGTDSGKTTLLRSMIDLLPDDKRIITIEDTPELPIRQPNHVNLYSGNLGATTMLKSTMRMRPDVVILGEVRGEEAYDFLNLAQSGHGGTMVSVHASSVDAAFNRLAMMVGQSKHGARVSDDAVRGMLNDVVDVVINLSSQRRIREVWYRDAA